MAALQRPVWTVVFALCWLLLAIGTMITHVALATMIPAIQDLPLNLIKGFGIVFRFDYLEQDSEKLKAASMSALSECSLTPQDGCNYDLAYLATLGKSDSSDERQEIENAFSDSLTMVKRVATDMYFGTEVLKEQAARVEDITKELKKLGTTGTCVESGPVFCSIYASANQLHEASGEVNEELDSFRTGKAITDFEDKADHLDYLHALPWIMVLSLICFSVFWLRGGVCCCCRGGTTGSCCLLIPHVILLLVFFIISAVIVGAGVAVQHAMNEVTVDAVNCPDEQCPTVKELLDHIEIEYPEFWAVVFQDLVDGLELWFNVSIVMVVFCILITKYACAVCCCRPYQVADAAAKGENDTKEEHDTGAGNVHGGFDTI